MKRRRPTAQKDYSSLFLSGILLGIVVLVLAVVLAVDQLRGHGALGGAGRTDEQSGRTEQLPGFSMNDDSFILASREPIRSD